MSRSSLIPLAKDAVEIPINGRLSEWALEAGDGVDTFCVNIETPAFDRPLSAHQRRRVAAAMHLALEAALGRLEKSLRPARGERRL